MFSVHVDYMRYSMSNREHRTLLKQCPSPLISLAVVRQSQCIPARNPLGSKALLDLECVTVQASGSLVYGICCVIVVVTGLVELGVCRS